MSANTKSNLSIILVIIGMAASFVLYVFNSGGSAQEIKTNANKVPSIEASQAEANRKLDVVIVKLDDHMESEKKLHEADRTSRDQLIETNKSLIDALARLK